MTNETINIPKLIYHYCSIEAFLSIIQNGELYLSTTKYMNDSMESKLLFPRIKKMENQQSEAFWVTNLYKAVDLIPQYKSGIHISCFSAHKDLLSQWRGYANDGTGIAIGVDTKILTSGSSKTNKRISNLALLKVVYDSTEQNKKIIDIFSKFNAEFNELWSLPEDHPNYQNHSYPGNFEPITMKDLLQKNNSSPLDTKKLNIKYTQQLITLSYLFKNAAFQEEGEYRLCYFQDFNFLDSFSNDSISLGEANCYTRNGNLKTYYPLKLNNKSIIKKIILGPKCQTDKETIRFALKKFGFDKAAVFKSEASYR